MPKRLAWYPIRVTYGRVLLLKKHLDNLNIKCFVPLILKTKLVKDKPVSKWVPAINNYIFIYTDKTTIAALKKDMEEIIPIRYLMDRTSNTPKIIPTKEMEHFIAVSGSMNEQLIYLKPDECNLQKGDKVKIIDGPFKGVEGTFMRVRGDRRVVVTIEGIVAVATTFIHPSLIKPVK